jgi:elongation factor P hydroxylase
MSHDARALEPLFAACFEATHRTILVGGAVEPLYLPSPDPERRPHRILYREDFFASALHEVAHWCLAGRRRRTLEDYGYWYVPDGRDARQQAAFEEAEARPQALEWIFSEACGFEFHLSADNLGGGFGPSERFAGLVGEHKARYLDGALPRRARVFRQALEAISPGPPRPSRPRRPRSLRSPRRPGV